ncbi:MAG TPA: hypothetical protein VHA11_00955, partial [Bryobacteraceae bacterium]|nr:hypothetical protein [Bryobacteraceae bacterium]
MPKTPVLFALVAVAALAQDFSGTWKLTSQHAVSGALPEPASALLEIEQTAGRIRYTTPAATGRQQWAEFTLDGKPTRSTLGGLSLSSIAKWEGSALLVNTIVTGPSGTYTQMDRWRISRDRAKLTIGREVVRRGGTAEAQLGYERKDQAVAPAQPARPAAVETVPLRPEPAAAPAPNVPAPVAPPAPAPAPEPAVVKEAPPAAPASYAVPAGTSIPLTLINSVSTKQSAEGDRIYLSTAFPVVIDGRVVIPPGSYVAGTLTFVKRPGRVRGRGELYLRLDALTLPSGVTRDFRARAGTLDSEVAGHLDRREGSVQGE